MLTEEDEKLLSLTKLRYENSLKMAETIQSDNSIIGDILKCHIFTESLLEELIKLVLKDNADAVLYIRLTYEKKLSLVSRLKLFKDFPLLDGSIVGSLRKLNSLRNRISHKINLTISSSDIVDLFNGLESELCYGDDFLKKEPKILVKRYTAFIFGNMLPKFEMF